MIKYFRFTWEQVLWGISYQNLIMLSATIPSYNSKEDKGKEKSESVKEVNSPQELAAFLNFK